MLDALINAHVLAGASIFEHDDPQYYAFPTAHAAIDAIHPGERPGSRQDG